MPYIISLTNKEDTIVFRFENKKKTFVSNGLDQIGLAKSNFTTEKPAYLLIPRQIILEKTIEVPTIEKKQAIQMAQMQLISISPLNDDESLVLPHWFIPKDWDQSDKSLVVFYILPKKNLISIVNNLNIPRKWNIQGFIIQGLGIPKFLTKKTESSINHFIWLLPDEIYLGFFEQEHLISSRSIQHSAINPSSFSELHHEIKNSFKTLSEKAPGGLSDQTSILVFEKNLDDFEKIINNFVSSDNKYELISLTETDLCSINLPHNETNPLHFIPEIQSKDKTNRRIKLFIQLTFSLVLSVFLFGYFFNTKTSSLKTKVAKLDQELFSLKKQYKNIESENERAILTKGHYQRTQKILNVIYFLYQALPTQVKLSSLNIRTDGLFTLKGEAPTGAIKIVDLLEQSSLLHNVKLKYQNKSRQGKIEFQIVGEVGNV